LGRTLSVGANLSGDMLFLARSKVTPSATAARSPEAESVASYYAQDGTSLGGGLSLTALIGLHF
jgi:hypothetical protein